MSVSDAAWALELVEDEGLDGRCAADPREAARLAAGLRAHPSADKTSLLFYFVHRNWAKLVQLLLADGPPSNLAAPAIVMASVVHEAASSGSVEALRLLLLGNVDTDTYDILGNTPLMAAVRRGNPGCTRELLGLHPDLRHLNAGGFNVLHECIISFPPGLRTTDGSVADRMEIFTTLLPHFKDDIDVRTIQGHTPADPQVTYNRTPLNIACQGGNHAMVKTLLAAGASRTAHDSISFSCLHKAAHKGHLACVTMLIGRPENQKMSATEINARDSKGRTPLFSVRWSPLLLRRAPRCRRRFCRCHT